MGRIRKIQLLGSGTSTGVPEVGCYCATCLSDNPKDRRTRISLLIQTTTNRNILIDCSPDFCQQAIANRIDHVDAIIITHEHYDHIGGLDDLRTLAWRKPITIYAEQRVIDAIRQRLHYYFGPNPYAGTPPLILQPITREAFDVEGISFQPIRLFHGKLPIYGYRFEDTAFITDLKTIEPEQKRWLEGCELLLINGLRFSKPHPTHQTIEEAIEMAQQAHVGLSYIVHLSHHAPPYEMLSQRLPNGVKAAYDGLTLMRNQVGEWGEVIETLQTFNMNDLYQYIDCESIRYAEALKKQTELFEESVACKVAHQPTDNYLLFCEHEPVFTLGKHGESNNLLVSEYYIRSQGIELHHLNRGGDITYHGPGQITGYPIFDLETLGIGIKEYITLMEEAIILLLKVYRIKGERMAGATGVWIDADQPTARKVCAIGVHASRFITMHGFALNVNCDLNYYKMINPCGFVDKGVTSIAQEVGETVDFATVKHQLEGFFREVFGRAYIQHQQTSQA